MFLPSVLFSRRNFPFPDLYQFGFPRYSPCFFHESLCKFFLLPSFNTENNNSCEKKQRGHGQCKAVPLTVENSNVDERNEVHNDNYCKQTVISTHLYFPLFLIIAVLLEKTSLSSGKLPMKTKADVPPTHI
jgi:hypothetical protein